MSVIEQRTLGSNKRPHFIINRHASTAVAANAAQGSLHPKE